MSVEHSSRQEHGTPESTGFGPESAAYRKKEIHLAHPELTGLAFRYCGYQQCASGYAYGPTVRDEYILHFVRSGTGYYRIDERTFHVHPNSSFLLIPGHIVHYQADKADPWEYYWVAFDGPCAPGLTEKLGLYATNPIVVHPDATSTHKLFRRLVDTALERTLRSEFETLALFSSIMSVVTADALAKSECDETANQDPHDGRVQTAVAYIQQHYSEHDMSVDSIARYVLLERSYFSTIFKENMGISPNQFLNKVRIENACRMLADPSSTVKDVAYSTGYREPGYFDKVFRRHMGASPSEFRELAREAVAARQLPDRLDRSFFS